MKILRNRKFIIIGIALLVVAVVATILYVRNVAAAKNTLTASGTVETTQISIAAEATGKIQFVSVQEGDAVKSGEDLFALDDTVLQAQRKAAAAKLESAQAGAQVAQDVLTTAEAQYQTTLETALAQDQKSRLHDWFSKDPKQFDQPGWYFTRLEQIKAAQQQVDQAKKEVENAQSNLDEFTNSLDKAQFLEAEQRLLNARLNYLITRNVNDRTQNSTSSNQPVGKYNSTHCGTNDGYRLDNSYLTNTIYSCEGDPQLSAAGSTLYDNAKAELDSAQKAYNDLLATNAAREVLKVRAEVSVAQEHYYAALDFLRSLQTGDQSSAVTAAQGSVDQAQAAADQAQKAIDQAQADLDVLDAQISKLTVKSPANGIVLARVAEPGESISSGSPVLVVGDLNDLTITVYIPEDRFGEIHIGETADVAFDSYPNRKFTATVVYVSDQAEFTPRNIQTVDGRKTTVFAVKLKLDNTNGDLKPGMPGDVTFLQN